LDAESHVRDIAGSEIDIPVCSYIPAIDTTH